MFLSIEYCNFLNKKFSFVFHCFQLKNKFHNFLKNQIWSSTLNMCGNFLIYYISFFCWCYFWIIYKLTFFKVGIGGATCNSIGVNDQCAPIKNLVCVDNTCKCLPNWLFDLTSVSCKCASPLVPYKESCGEKMHKNS